MMTGLVFREILKEEIYNENDEKSNINYYFNFYVM